MTRVTTGYKKKTTRTKKINDLGVHKGAKKAPAKKKNHEKNHESAAAFRLLVRAMSAVTELYRSDETRPGFVLSDLGSVREGAGNRWYASIVRYDGREQKKVLLSTAYEASAEAAVSNCVRAWLSQTKTARGLAKDMQFLEVSE